jgi:hypothetical protein
MSKTAVLKKKDSKDSDTTFNQLKTVLKNQFKTIVGFINVLNWFSKPLQINVIMPF